MTDRVPLNQDKPAEPVVEASKPLVETTKENKLSYLDDIEYHRLADYLDIDMIDRKDDRMANELSYLFDWAKEVTKSEDRITRMEAIKGLQKTLGITKSGKDTVKLLYQYTRLDQDKRRIEREQDLLINKPGV